MTIKDRLINAFKNNHANDVILLLTQHPELTNEILQDGKAPLHWAIEKGDLKLVQALTTLKGINLNVRAHMPNSTLDGMTPVFMASYLTKNADILTHLIQEGADTSIATTNGQTPLTVATHANMLERVHILVLTENVNINSIVVDGSTALINAVEKGNATMVSIILSIPASKILNHKKNGESALFIAAKLGEIGKVEALLQMPDLDIEATRTPGDGKTALQIAVEKSQPKIALLINNFKQQNQLLQKISKKINLDLLAADPLIESPLLVKKSSVLETKKHNSFPSYSQYLTTQRKIPSDAEFLNYLTELDNFLTEAKSLNSLTHSEQTQIKARKIWSDTVSDTDRVITECKKQNDIKGQVIEKLKNLGYTTNTEKILQDCIQYLKTNTAIVMTFNAAFLTQGLTSYQPLNFFEQRVDSKNRTNEYRLSRDAGEKILFQSLKSEINNALLNCSEARPRYSALILLDSNHTIEAITNYGNSFVVLQNIVKLNSLFNPHDSLVAKYSLKQNLQPCTYHHLEYILYQCTNSLLIALAERSTKGILPINYSQQYKGTDPYKGGYIEVMLPAIDLLDSEFVQHIHINDNEYKLKPDEIAAFSLLEISITNSSTNPYPALCQDIMKFLETNNVTCFENLLKSYPSLALITNKLGEEPIHIAARKGFIKIVKLLLAQGIDPNRLDRNGKALLHSAVESGNLELVRLLTTTSGVNLNVRTQIPNTTYDGMTPVFLASYLTANADILTHLIQKGADTSIATTNGQTPLTIAAYKNLLERVNALVHTKNVNLDSIIVGGYTALTNAVENGNTAIVKTILSVSESKILNHKKNGESALFIAAKLGDVEKVDALLQMPDIDIEAARTPGDGKTALQVAQTNRNWKIVQLLKLAFYKKQTNNQPSNEDLIRLIKHEIEEINNVEILKRFFENEIKDFKSFTKMENTSIENINLLINNINEEKEANKKYEIILGCFTAESQRLSTPQKQKLFSSPNSTLATKLDKVKAKYLQYLTASKVDVKALTDAYLLTSYHDFLKKKSTKLSSLKLSYQ